MRKKISSKKRVSKSASRKTALADGTLMQHLKLEGIRIVESRSKMEIFGNSPPGEDIQVSTALNITRNDEGGTIVVSLRNMFETPKPPKELTCKLSYVDIACVIQCLFKIEGVELPDELSHNDAQALVTTARFASWPYLRQFVQSTTMMMGIGPVLLPLLTLQLGIPQEAALPDQ